MLPQIDYIEVTHRVAQYVHEHLGEPVTVEILAAEAGVSKFHLNRIFHSVTGFQLGEFVARRRMERAYLLLVKGEDSVLDIALEVGYESHPAFSRAFRKVFGLRPAEVKNEQIERWRIPDTLKRPSPAGVKPDVCGPLDQPLLGFYGQGFVNQSFVELAQDLFGKLHNLLLNYGFRPAELRHFGVALESPWQVEHDQARFFAGVLIEGCEELPGLELYRCAPASWVRVRHRGAHRDIWKTVSRFYADTVIPCGYSLCDQALVQEYRNDPRGTEPAQLETDLYFPLTGG